MPRQANYNQWTTGANERDRTAEAAQRDVDISNPFEDPEVCRRIAEIIARSARNATKSGR
jgi:UDP-N-acetylglucosamine 2-epimerase